MINETRTVLANLDWLILHENVRLDYPAGVVYGRNGEPYCLVSDLATMGLTPATAPQIRVLDPALWDIYRMELGPE